MSKDFKPHQTEKIFFGEYCTVTATFQEDGSFFGVTIKKGLGLYGSPPQIMFLEKEDIELLDKVFKFVDRG